MNNDIRLNKIERSLTPKQAVVLWLQEIQHVRNVYELINYLKERPESEAPITKLTRQMNQAVKQSFKGKPSDIINAAVRRAERDVVFLIKLQHQINYEVMLNERRWRLSQIALSEALGRLHVELMLRNYITDLADRVNFQTPYPLDPEMAAIVDSAVLHHVHTCEAMVEESYICDWLWEFLIDQGAKELPLSASTYRDGKKQINVTPENEAEIRACFSDSTQFELFRSGQDYSYDLASVNDAEYNRHYESIVSNIEKLVKSGRIAAGKVVRLESIPISFLRNVPLVEGQWIDQQVVELAEWGALLKSKGYQAQDADTAHLLAMVKFNNANGDTADPVELLAICRKAKLFLKKYSGRIQHIDGRTFIHFEDYCQWKGRKVKGSLQQSVEEGLITESWNRWIEGHSGINGAKVGDVPVGEIHCYVNNNSYYSCQCNSEGQLDQREQLLENIRGWSFKPDRKENLIQEWKDSVTYCLTELYAFRQAITSLQKNFFNGQPVLFTDLAQELAAIITLAETTTNNFNSSFTQGLELFKPVDLEFIRSNANSQVSRVVTYIVDMAKAEALDCLGDTDAGVKLAERYL